MKVIFLQDVKKQAKKDEIKEVKDGYANYLINNKLAVAYTPKSASVLKNEIEARQAQEDDIIAECNQIKNKLKDKIITFKVKTGNNGKIFGSITTKQISEELNKLGFKIDKKKLQLYSDINTLGEHIVKINLHKKVSFDIRVSLIK